MRKWEKALTDLLGDTAIENDEIELARLRKLPPIKRPRQ